MADDDRGDHKKGEDTTPLLLWVVVVGVDDDDRGNFRCLMHCEAKMEARRLYIDDSVMTGLECYVKEKQ